MVKEEGTNQCLKYLGREDQMIILAVEEQLQGQLIKEKRKSLTRMCKKEV